MATKAGKIAVDLEARTAKFQQDMHRARDIVKQSGAQMQQAMNQTKNSFNGAVSGLIAFRGSTMAAIAAVTGLIAAVSKAASAAMRYETLGVVMRQVGDNAGYSASEMEGYAKSLEETGISMLSARDAVIKMVSANLDLTKSSQLARVAQDAAVIGNINSSEAFERMIHGIQSGNTLILKTIGINVDFEESYKRIAKATGRTTAQLSTGEKMQIRMNATIEDGERKAGVYGAALGTVGKQVGTLSRHLENLKVKFGQAMTSAMPEVVAALGEEIQKLGDAVDENKEGITGLFKSIAVLATGAVRAVGELTTAMVRLGEHAAIAVHGISAHDTKRVDGAIKDLTARIEKLKKANETGSRWTVGPATRAFNKSEIERMTKELERFKLMKETVPKGFGAETPSTPGDPSKRAAAGKPQTDDEKAKKLIEKGEQAILQLQRERAEIGQVTEEEKMLWETTQGRYKDLNASQKQRLVGIAIEIDSLKMQKEAEDEIIKNWEKNEETIATLKDQAATIGMTETQTALYGLALKEATAAQLEMASAALADVEQKKALREILDEIRSPYEDYLENINQANWLLAAGTLSIEEYTAYMGKMAKKIEEVTTGGKDQFAELKQAIDGWGKDSAKAIADFAISGSASFSDMAQSIIKDMMSMMIYQSMMKPLFDGIGSGASSILSGLFGGAGGGVSNSAAFTAGASGFSFLGRAGGGLVSPGKMYEVNEMGLPELLNIGNRQFLMMGNNSGSVVAAAGVSSGGGSSSPVGGGAPIVNIFNNSGAEVTTREGTQGADLDVMVDALVAKKLGQRNSQSARMMRNNYGAKEPLVSRG